MVGLPYPNKNSPELKEKMEFLNKNIGVSRSDPEELTFTHFN